MVLVDPATNAMVKGAHSLENAGRWIDLMDSASAHTALPFELKQYLKAMYRLARAIRLH
jgi:hypothetical protein